MRFICPLFPYDRWGGLEPLVEGVRVAEELGYDAVSLPEHVVMPLRPDVPPVSVVWYDPIVLAAVLGARTSTIRLVLHALVVPYHPPVQTAKQLATLDVASEGRITVVAGSGWMRREFAALGVPFEQRGEITDEYLRAMRELWTAEHPAFSGPRVAFGDIAFAPRGAQSPHLPLWIGGSGPRPIRRVVELGDGWAPMAGSIAEIGEQVDRLRQALAAAGRDPARLDVVHSLRLGAGDPAAATASSHAGGGGDADPDRADSAEQLADLAGRAAAAGITHLGVGFAWAGPAEHAERLGWFAAEVIPRCPARTD